MKSVFLGKIAKDFNFTNDSGEKVSGTYYRLVHGELGSDGICYPITCKINKRIYDSLSGINVFDDIEVDVRIVGSKFDVLSVNKL